MLNVQTATREDLEIALLEDASMMAAVGGFDAALTMSTDAMREKITEWIVAGDEMDASTKAGR